ncbi:MAG TPA: TonB-dependent receptor plug domain-containing protein, partial [Telluria sp.]|nr:TonB-dependent receptor plug domain-containing protein [Telluria sp.]
MDHTDRLSARCSAAALLPWLAAAVAPLLLALPAGAADVAAVGGDFAELSIEELANIQITSVSKKPERLADAAASVFVITADDIRRSGADTLADALRLAPNLQVAQVSSGGYAISARGLNGSNNSAPNKLLVLIDGRSVYSPLFSGVFWDAQDVMLEDVERIEVISGPGGTLWGVNAVNGVINISTRAAKDTQGSLATLNGGPS